MLRDLSEGFDSHSRGGRHSLRANEDGTDTGVVSSMSLHRQTPTKVPAGHHPGTFQLGLVASEQETV